MLVLVAATALHATQVEYRSPKQMGSESSLVLRGHVLRVRSFWSTSHTKILTEASIRVDKTYKGPNQAEVRVVQLGGRVGHVRMSVHGALSWVPGEDVIVFLEPAGSGAWQVSGFTQGKYRVRRNAATGEAFVEAPPADNIEKVGTPHSGARPSLRSQSVSQFIASALGR